MSDSEQQHSSSHRRFNDDDDEEQHQPDSVTIISPKDYNSIKQCTDLSRRSILNPAIGAPVWTAVRKYIFMQFILFKINDVCVKHSREYHPKIDLQIIRNRGGLTNFNANTYSAKQAWEIASAILDRIIPHGPVFRVLQGIKWPTPILMFIHLMDNRLNPKTRQMLYQLKDAYDTLVFNAAKFSIYNFFEQYDTAREAYLEYCNTKTGSNLERVEAVTVTPQQDWDHLVLSFMRGPSMMIFRAEFRRITREMDEWSASLEETDLFRYRQQLISCYEAAVEDGVVPNRDNVTLGTLSADSSQSRRARFTAYGAEYGFGEANDESYEANAAQDSHSGLNMQPPPIFGQAAYQSPYQGTTERGARTPMASAVRQTVRRPAERRVSFKPPANTNDNDNTKFVKRKWPEGMSSDTKDKTYGESIGQTTACRAPCKDPKTGKISTCKSAKHSTKDHPKENFEANLAIIDLFGRDIDSPFDYEDAEDWTVQQVDVPVPVALAPAIPAEAKTWMAWSDLLTLGFVIFGLLALYADTIQSTFSHASMPLDCASVQHRFIMMADNYSMLDCRQNWCDEHHHNGVLRTVMVFQLRTPDSGLEVTNAMTTRHDLTTWHEPLNDFMTLWNDEVEKINIRRVVQGADLLAHSSSPSDAGTVDWLFLILSVPVLLIVHLKSRDDQFVGRVAMFLATCSCASAQTCNVTNTAVTDVIAQTQLPLDSSVFWGGVFLAMSLALPFWLRNKHHGRKPIPSSLLVDSGANPCIVACMPFSKRRGHASGKTGSRLRSKRRRFASKCRKLDVSHPLPWSRLQRHHSTCHVPEHETTTSNIGHACYDDYVQHSRTNNTKSRAHCAGHSCTSQVRHACQVTLHFGKLLACSCGCSQSSTCPLLTPQLLTDLCPSQPPRKLPPTCSHYSPVVSLGIVRLRT